MKLLLRLQLLFLAAITSLLSSQAPSKDASDRGDVPGWVMITMMTAILVAALLVVAQDALVNMFNQAMSMVSG